MIPVFTRNGTCSSITRKMIPLRTVNDNTSLFTTSLGVDIKPTDLCLHYNLETVKSFCGAVDRARCNSKVSALPQNELQKLRKRMQTLQEKFRISFVLQKILPQH